MESAESGMSPARVPLGFLTPLDTDVLRGLMVTFMLVDGVGHTEALSGSSCMYCGELPSCIDTLEMGVSGPAVSTICSPCSVEHMTCVLGLFWDTKTGPEVE